ncbi:Uncharacterised protein [Sphingobacterium spiritivorum]|uniref:Uncharacterized protein n=1 Tax=Sphingobacterium spiritivorum TaxID=258 RepID=A0A380BU89_SPHSI|nr:hypothetical protein [Sphingobacterium spiritivorum]SUJ06658.1 Uncharacterised protein [Sphingobacterium spiritivorum]
MKRLFPVLLILVLFTSVYSCKKSDNPDNKKDTEEDMIKDSVFYYTKVLSLWEGSMPPSNVNTLDDKGVVRSYTKKICYRRGSPEIYDGPDAFGEW